VLPRYIFQYLLPSERPRINELIEDSILEAENSPVSLTNKEEMFSRPEFLLLIKLYGW